MSRYLRYSSFKKLLVLTFLFFYSATSFSFKVDSHVWIAQEIIDDLKDDGRITVIIGGVSHTFAPPSHYVQAILNYPDEFKTGAVGPDAAPDIIIGQMLIHPGDRGYGTDEWLDYLLKNAQHPNEIAYALGFMVHAASDVFAHTYVNTYGGGVFLLGEEGLENERRHFLLESFISKLTPRLSTQKEAYVGLKFPSTDDLYERDLAEHTAQCRVDERDGLNFDTCMARFFQRWNNMDHTDFMQRVFFYKPDDVVLSVTQNGTKSAVVYPESMLRYRQAGASASYLPAVYALRYRLEQLIQSKTLLDMDVYITQQVVYYWTDYMPTDQEALKLNEWHQRVKSLEYDAQENIQRVKNEIEDFVSKSTIRLNTRVVNSVRSLENNINKLNTIHYSIIELDRKVHDWENELSHLVCRIDPILGATGVCDKIKSLKSKINDGKQQIATKIVEFASTRTAVSNALEDLFRFAQTVDFVRRNIDNTVTDLAQVLMKDVNPIRAVLKNWAGGVDAAMASYRPVGLAMMQEAMKPSGNALAPLEKWAFTDCNLIKLIGAGDEVGSSACKLTRSVKALMTEIDTIKPLLGPNGGILVAEVHRAINDVINAELERLKSELKQRLVNDALNRINPDLASFINTLMQGVSDSGLNTEFASTDSSAPNYVLIPDVAARVRAEMRVTSSCNGKSECFDKNKYPVVRNAIALSKLAILNGSGLNQLAVAAGASNPWLYNELTGNVLLGAVKSIDGDHPWYGSKTPPYPTYASISTTWPTKNYGYDSPKGMLIWNDSDARNKVFNRVFVGPLVEGLFTPKSLGNFSDVLPATYRAVFNTCKTVPYPVGNGNSCVNDPDLPSGEGSGGTVITSWSLSGNCLGGYQRVRSTISAPNASRYQVDYQVGSTWYALYDSAQATVATAFDWQGEVNFRARALAGSTWSTYSSNTLYLNGCSGGGGGIEP